jgi:carbamoyl-phosphate synthase small subunit
VSAFPPALLALADGTVFHGKGIGAVGSTVGEVVFNTSMSGYQEILTDPSYCRQIVTLTYPHIGNTGINPEDVESDARAGGRSGHPRPAHPAVQLSHDPAPRRLPARRERGRDRRTRHPQAHPRAAREGCAGGLHRHRGRGPGARRRGRRGPGARLSPASPAWTSPRSSAPPSATPGSRPSGRSDGGYGDRADGRFHVVAYDFGVKYNILRMLVERGCRLTVVPAQTPAAEVLALNPDGVFLSNGPGDPEPCDYAIAAIRELVAARMPTFGICLGHQLLALASGAKTMKMPTGHHGANHPVKDLDTGKVLITSQNHGFAVDPATMPANLKVTHVSLFDGTNQGIARTDVPAFSFQGHPEASPGPHDVAYLFDRFIGLMEAAK